ncbi:MAG: hypothetical protein Q8Q04_03010 [archaeon]|nr:hypothetical protein [archaeon]
MKRGLILGFILAFSLNLVSAYGGSFNNFSISGFFSEFNISMFLTALLFVTIFTVIYFIVGKTPLGENTAVRWIVSLCVSSFSLWGIIQSGFSFENFLFQLGLTDDLLPIFLWIVGIVICIILIIKFKFRRFLGILFLFAGLLLLVLSILDVVYQKGVGIMIGIGLFIIGLILMKKKSGEYPEQYAKRLSKPKGKAACLLFLLAGMALAYFGFTGGDPLVLGIGALLIILGLFCLFHHRKDAGISPNASPREIGRDRIIYKKRQRSIYDLKQKYMSYLFQYNRRGQTAHQREEILKAMNIIISYAKKQGVSEREFLSRRVGNSNAKSPRELKRPFDG